MNRDKQNAKTKLKHEQHLNKKINYLTINSVYLAQNEKLAGFRYICTCDCGTKIEELPRKVLNGERKTCGKLWCPAFHEVRVQSSKKSSIGSFTGYKEIYGCRWAAWRCGAEKRNLQFSVTKEYAWQIFENQNRRCALSGVELCFDGKWNSRKTTASLDRIDSSKGYVVGNIQWVHKTVNLMKRDMTDEEFTKWCELVSLRRNTVDKR